MDSPVSLKKEWTLTQEAFELLLSSFDTDRERAGQRYERIRLKLVKYFEWRGASLPDVHADETINRVARKIGEGEDVHNLEAYFYGVARMVFNESLKSRGREHELLDEAFAVAAPAVEEDPDEARRGLCLDACLRRLSGENRDLIIEYYQEEKSGKIERRKRLAARLGIPLNALRIRAHRIRINLERCVRECVQQYA